MLREISLHGYFGFFFFFLCQIFIYPNLKFMCLSNDIIYLRTTDMVRRMMKLAPTNEYQNYYYLSIYLSIYIYIWSVWPFVDILIFCHITFGSPTILHIIFYEFIYYVKMRVLNWLLLSNMEKVFFFLANYYSTI